MQNHLILLSGFFIAVILSRCDHPRILIISLRKRLFDALDVRKVHKKPVSRLGIEQPIYRWYISRAMVQRKRERKRFQFLLF